jgi:hypothetical protein
MLVVVLAVALVVAVVLSDFSLADSDLSRSCVPCSGCGISMRKPSRSSADSSAIKRDLCPLQQQCVAYTAVFNHRVSVRSVCYRMNAQMESTNNAIAVTCTINLSDLFHSVLHSWLR